MSRVNMRANELPRESGIVKRVVQFFKDSYAELKKVVWPSREEVASSTKVVIISVVLVALALGIVDFVLISAVDLIF